MVGGRHRTRSKFDGNLFRWMLNAVRWLSNARKIFSSKRSWRADVKASYDPTNFSIVFPWFFFILSYYVPRFLESPHLYCAPWEILCRKLNNVTNDTLDPDHIRELTQTNKRTNETEKSPIECNQTECRNEQHKVHGPRFSIAWRQRCHAKVMLEISASQRLIQQFFSILYFPNDSMELYGFAIKRNITKCFHVGQIICNKEKLIAHYTQRRIEYLYIERALRVLYKCGKNDDHHDHHDHDNCDDDDVDEEEIKSE